MTNKNQQCFLKLSPTFSFQLGDKLIVRKCVDHTLVYPKLEVVLQRPAEVLARMGAHTYNMALHGKEQVLMVDFLRPFLPEFHSTQVAVNFYSD